MGSSPPVFENRRALRARSSRRVDFPTPRAAFPDGVTKLPILEEKLGRFGGGLRQIRVDRLMQLREDNASAFSEARGAPSRSIIREHEVTSSTVVSPMPIPHAPEVASGIWGMDGGAHEWAPGTHDLYSENPTR